MSHILVVDDQQMNTKLLNFLLTDEGYQVAVTHSGSAALAELQTNVYDLILLDVMMPGMDGWEMLRRVQDRHGVGAVPVIMFSGKVDAGGAAAAEARGAEAFIGKPFDPEQLVASTKQLLRS